jgi:hypothetical protein
MPSHAQEPNAEEQMLLRIVSEQQAVQIDHLARFLGIYVSDTAREVESLRLRGWVAVEELLTGHLPWVIATGPGARLAGTGFKVLRPSVRSLPHIRAINEARLLLNVEHPEGRWICERELRRHWQRKKVRNIPDGVFEIGGERWAIEVELSRKPIEYLRANIREHASRYDAVLYFCSKGMAGFIERQDLLSEFSENLFVWDTFDPIRQLDSAEFQVEKRFPRLGHRHCPSPSSAELLILDLISEQGAIPIDQLARFQGCDFKEATALGTRLLEAGFVKRSRPLSGEPDWLWLTRFGVSVSTTGLDALSPKVGGLAQRRALNEVRLLFAERAPGARWVSERILRKAQGMKGSVPGAVVEVGSDCDLERQAIEVCLSHKRSIKDRVTRMEMYRAKFDAATFFCSSSAEKTIQTAASRCRWPNLLVLPIPGDLTQSRLLDRRSQAPPFEPLEPGVFVARLRMAVHTGQLQPSRARALAGYLLLREAGVSAGGKRTKQELQRDCRKLELVVDSTSQALFGQSSLAASLPPELEDLVRRAYREVESGNLRSSRARTLVGYFVLDAVGVPQGARSTIHGLQRDLAALRA